MSTARRNRFVLRPYQARTVGDGVRLIGEGRDVLFDGPTGSGKSTTLYATLNIVSKPEVNVITVEDPVEYRLPGINQVQTNNKAGLTFASALRSILRSDPDVVLIGEIRDHETAQIAVEASLTGGVDVSGVPAMIAWFFANPVLCATATSASPSSTLSMVPRASRSGRADASIARAAS